MHHPTKILHQNAFGSVSQCLGCGDVHIALGNLLFALPQSQYSAFVHMFRRIRKQEPTTGTPLPLHLQYRPFLLKVPADNLYMAISAAEYQQALEVLSMAEILIFTLHHLQ